MQSDGPFHCKSCNLLFSSRERLHEHKGSMRRNGKPKHIHCKFCGEDFKTERAEILHIQEKHPQEQNLECPACGAGPFIRLGGLMDHIEKHCYRLDSTVVAQMRQEKLEFPTQLETLTDQNVKANYANYMPSTRCGDSDQWNVPDSAAAKPFLPKQDDFPALGSCSSQTTSSARPHDQSATAQNTPPPRARTLDDLLDPHDPDHPNFNSARYYCPAAEKFSCPKIGCTKMFKNATGLVGHLRSTAHSNNKYRCPYCQRTFGSLTAITQHAESSSVRCNIRMADEYDAYLDQLTGGIVDVAKGSHQDGTPKYETTAAAREAFGRGEKSAGPADVAESDAGDAEDQW